MPAKPRPKRDDADSHPLRHTTASVMLAVAVDASDLGMGELGRRMGYGAANRSSLSHMASGIQPVPLDKAETIATVAGLDVGAFTLAVLHQRHPEAADELWKLKGVDHPPVLSDEDAREIRSRLDAEGPTYARTAMSRMARAVPWD